MIEIRPKQQLIRNKSGQVKDVSAWQPKKKYVNYNPSNIRSFNYFLGCQDLERIKIKAVTNEVNLKDLQNVRL